MAPVSTKILPLPEKRPERVTLPASTVASRVPTMRSPRDVARAHLQFDLPRLGTDVVDDDVASWGGDRHVAAGVPHRNVAGFGQDLQFAGESTHLDVSGAGLDLHGAARRNSKGVVSPCAPAPSVSRTKVESWRERSTGTSEAFSWPRPGRAYGT